MGRAEEGESVEGSCGLGKKEEEKKEDASWVDSAGDAARCRDQDVCLESKVVYLQKMYGLQGV